MIAAAALAAIADVGARPQQPGSPATERSARTWTVLAFAHTPGQLDDAARELARWSRAESLAALAEAPRWLRTPDAARPTADLTALLRHALMLHTDVGVLFRSESGYQLPPGQMRSVLITDGQGVGTMSSTFQWELGRRIIAAVPDPRERAALARPWYRASSASLQLWGELPELRSHIDEGLKLNPGDPYLLLYGATLHETNADARVRDFLAAEQRQRGPTRGGAAGSLVGPTPTGLVVPSVKDELEAAERQLRAALRTQPDLAEAHVRLGHVLGDRDRHAEAAAELTTAMAATLPPLLEYFSQILAGREAEALGRLDDAARAFARAAQLYPDAQSPRLGASRVAVLRGDQDAAGAALTALARTDGRLARLDPWWRYLRLHEPSAQALYADLARELRR